MPLIPPSFLHSPPSCAHDRPASRRQTDIDIHAYCISEDHDFTIPSLNIYQYSFSHPPQCPNLTTQFVFPVLWLLRLWAQPLKADTGSCTFEAPIGFSLLLQTKSYCDCCRHQVSTRMRVSDGLAQNEAPPPRSHSSRLSESRMKVV